MLFAATKTTMKTTSAASNTSTTIDISATNDTNAAAAAIDAANAAVTVADGGADMNETGNIVFINDLEGNDSSSGEEFQIVTKSSSVSFLPFLSLLIIPLIAAAIIAAVIIHR